MLLCVRTIASSDRVIEMFKYKILGFRYLVLTPSRVFAIRCATAILLSRISILYYFNISNNYDNIIL